MVQHHLMLRLVLCGTLLCCQHKTPVDDSIPETSDPFALPTGADDGSSGRYFQEVYTRVNYRDIQPDGAVISPILVSADKDIDDKEWLGVIDEPEFKLPPAMLAQEKKEEPFYREAKADNAVAKSETPLTPLAVLTQNQQAKLPPALAEFLNQAHPVNLIMFSKAKELRIYSEPQERAAQQLTRATQLSVKQRHKDWAQLTNGSFVKISDLAERPIARSKHSARWK